jgi:hypothetical protein
MAPTPSQLFSDRRGAALAERFEEYKDTLGKSFARADEGRDVFVRGVGLVKGARPSQAGRAEHDSRMETIERLSKSLPSDQLAAMQTELDALKGTLAKDWDASFPESGTMTLPTQLAPIDLEAPAKLLVPRQTPLRNQMPRNNGGKGSAVQFRRILGWSNAGVGGVPDILPFMSSEFPAAQSTSNLPPFGGYANTTGGVTSGGLGLRRGQKITYAADSQVRNYTELGLSDSVSWKAEFIGQGYQDIRQLSATALLWAHLMGEERALLYGRGPTANGYTGPISAPTFTATAAASGVGTSTLATTSYYYVLTAIGGGGEGIGTAASSATATTSGQVNNIVVTVPVAGALGYNLYMNTTGTGNFFYVASFSGTTYTVAAPVSTGSTIIASALDTSANPNAYDGMLTILTNPAKSGFVGTYAAPTAAVATSSSIGGNSFLPNTTTAGAAIGDRPWQLAFQALYGSGTEPGVYADTPIGTTPFWPYITGTAYGQKLLADPDVVFVDGSIRKAMGDFVRAAAGGSTAYRITMQTSEATGGLEVGGVVNGLANQVTGKMVDFDVHPYMPPGCSLIWSKTLPVPDSEVANTFEVRNVQEYMMYPWPVIQYTYDASTYQLGTLVDYASAWSGAITGLVP